MTMLELTKPIVGTPRENLDPAPLLALPPAAGASMARSAGVPDVREV